MTTDQFDWNRTLREQCEDHWERQVRPRLAGLTDEEYFWSPVPNPWNVTPRGASSAAIQGGSGDFTIDFAYPEPDPVPFTTIAWRLGHVIVGVFAMRNASHFGAPATDYNTWDYAGDAATAIRQLETQLDIWLTGLRGLTEADLQTPLGAKELFPDEPMAALVLHIHREFIHHMAEICLLRDLYLHTKGTPR
ncbi:DinB family protein [Nocardia macrotermitis]|uniref:DinB-like domain-containing protein n=1 Tax=Nocardia macrotermitis TaxID=2585198 RepID=A0A7K0CU70_9NOCA|nr:DinB family protein [Nocardia macrotermitis]MQY17037.1 hypothetical protein [Nocardia macrotermitis]